MNRQFCIAFITYSLFLITSLYAQRPDYKDRTTGDTVIINKKTYIIHKCTRDETIFTIAAKYKVSVNDLDNANKDVINNLKKNTILIVPIAAKQEEIIKDVVKVEPPKDIIYNITLLIPFNADVNYKPDSTLAAGYFLQDDLDKETLSGLEFYEGVLTALDTLKKKGLKARIAVVDGYDSASVAAAKLKPELTGADLIITNLGQNLVGLLGNFTVNGKPLIVSCATNTAPSLKNDSNAFFTTPSSLLQCRRMGDFLAKESTMKDRIIVVRTSGAKEIERANAFLAALTDVPGKTINKSLFDTTASAMKTIKAALEKGKNNIIFIPSSSEAYVSDWITLLKTFKVEYEITLVGLPTWQYFQSVNPEDLALLKTTIFAAIYISYDTPPVIAFRKTFREIYLTEPSEHAFTGYDAMLYFGEELFSRGIAFPAQITGKNFTGLSTRFHFTKQSIGGGYENDYITVLKFEDYMLKSVTGD